MLDINERYNRAKNLEIEEMNEAGFDYEGPALEFNDPEALKQIRKRELIAQKEIAWRGSEDVELVISFYQNFLYGSTMTTRLLMNKNKTKQDAYVID